MKNILTVFEVMAYIIGTIGGIGHTVRIGEYVTAICIAVLAFLAYPTIKKIVAETTGKE